MSNIVRCIGDVHGKWAAYRALIEASPYPTIQVGDFGWGFHDSETYVVPEDVSWAHHAAGWTVSEFVVDKAMKPSHRYIRGNHDNPEHCRNHDRCIPDGTIEDGVMFVGGALSIDKDFRTENWDWWQDEELSYEEGQKVIDAYKAARPRVMVTHDFPEHAARELFAFYDDSRNRSRTRDILEACVVEHQPKLWIGGHWHVARDQTIYWTRYVCLPELAYVDVDLDTLEVDTIKFPNKGVYFLQQR